MKWRNKGHEFDAIAEPIVKKWNASNDIYIFGAGMIGHKYKDFLEKFGVFSGFIDNNSQKCSEEALSLNDFLSQKENGWIVLCASDSNIEAIRQQLSDMKLDDSKYFVYCYREFFKDIFPLLSVYCLGKVYDNLCQISLTERCTLHCAKCAHGCWNVPRDAEDLNLDYVLETADRYFKAFDHCIEFVLIGGEPLLYRDLSKAIEYIGKKYRDKMTVFSITTNGTLLPGEELLNVCKKYKVHIHISNYTKTLPQLKNRYEELVNLLTNNGIEHELSNEDDTWVDYGFDTLVRGDDEDLEKVFDACKTPCREVRGDKYYFCVQARSVNDNMKFGVGEDDYFDLSIVDGSNGKKILFEFCNGFSDKGYLDMCRYCYGKGALDRIIPRAEQK
jgi:hypothetical protein